MPLKTWVKSALDRVIQDWMGEPDLEFAWVGDDAIDPLSRRRERPGFSGHQNKQENIFLTAYSGRGIVSYSGRLAPAAKRPPPSPLPLHTSFDAPAPFGRLGARL